MNMMVLDLFGEMILAKQKRMSRSVRKHSDMPGQFWIQQELNLIVDYWESVGLPADFADKAWFNMHESLLHEVLGQFKGDGRMSMTNIQEKWHWVTAPLVPDHVAGYLALTFQACCLACGLNAEDLRNLLIAEIQERHPTLLMPSEDDQAQHLMSLHRDYLDMRLRLTQRCENHAIRMDILKWVQSLQEDLFSFAACWRAYGIPENKIESARRQVLTSFEPKEVRKAG